VINVEPNQTAVVTAALKPRTTASTNTAATADDFFARGNTSFASHDYPKAIEEYTRALNLAPNMREAYAKRAEACIKVGDNQKAADDFIRVGEIYRFSNNSAKAAEAFTSALTYSPQSKIALVGRGGARVDNGDYRTALIDFESALKLDGNFYPALFGSGLSQFKLGNNKQADKYFKNAYRLNPADPYLYQYMMLNYLALDDIKNLKKIYAEYKAVAPPTELAEFRSSSRFAPIIRLVEGESR
jgi:tetratricopeptide (TPR) repeat protein